jgi:hypothetical protein
LVISTNILDSLLWDIAIRRESYNIISMDKERLEGYNKSREIIKSKIKTIPERQEKLSLERERITYSYIKGAISTEKYDGFLREVKR